MMARKRRGEGYGLPFLLAVGLHLGVVVLSVMRFPSADTPAPQQAIVQATLVSTESVTDRAQRVEDARSAAEQAVQEEQQELERQQAEREAQAAEEAEIRRQQIQQEKEQEQQAEQESQAQAEAAEREAQRRMQEAEQARVAREAAEQERQAEAEAEAQKKREAEAQAEAQKKREAEAEAEAQKKREAEAQAEAQRKRQADAAAAAQNSLEQAIANEADAAQGREAATGFIALVRRAVEQAWVIPPNVMGSAQATVAVTLGPSGELFSARVTQGSGDSAFDRSVEEAVQAAAPFTELSQLPASVQRDFRQFNLRFRPGEIR